MTKTKFIITITSSIIIGLVLFFTLTKNSSPTQKIIKHHPKDIDGFMDDISFTQYDSSGKLQQTIHSPKLLHYPENDSSKFENPTITVYKDNEPPWVITAKSGKAIDGYKKVTLIDDINIHQDQGDDNPPTTIKTSELTFEPKTKKIYSSKLVTLKQPNINISAVGVNIDLNNNDIELLSKAKGTYEGKI